MERKRSDEIYSVYIGNLSYTCDEGHILGMFKKFGYIKNVKLLLEGSSNKSKGVAFVDMVDREQAQQAITSLNGSSYKGRTLKVSLAKTQDFRGKQRLKKEKQESEKEKSLYKKINKGKKKKKGFQALLSFKAGK